MANIVVPDEKEKRIVKKNCERNKIFRTFVESKTDLNSIT